MRPSQPVPSSPCDEGCVGRSSPQRPVAGRRPAHVRSPMKPIAMFGMALIVVGLAALVYQGITYTSRETVIDIGPLHATADREKTLPLSPVLGVVAVAGGVVLLVAG